jgi:hypothetical protein
LYFYFTSGFAATNARESDVVKSGQFSDVDEDDGSCGPFWEDPSAKFSAAKKPAAHKAIPGGADIGNALFVPRFFLDFVDCSPKKSHHSVGFYS